jgi:cytochrome c oxidase subunit 4
MRGKDTSLVLVWLALLVLLGASAASAFVSLGAWNTVLNLGIALVKAALVMLFFMHLRRSHVLLRLAAGAGLATLAILFALSATDYATRKTVPAPYQPPRQLVPAAGAPPVPALMAQPASIWSSFAPLGEPQPVHASQPGPAR